MNSGRPAPLRGPFGIYYGWVIVASALLMNLATSPLNPVTYSFFMLPMGHDLGWSRSEMSLAITFRLVAAGVTAPILGGFMDRIGSRWMGMYAGFVAGASLIAIAYTDQLWMLYAVYTISGSAGFGGPGGALLTTVPVGKWFIVRRGRAMAIATVGFPIGTVIAIQVAQWLIDTAGWRTAWLVFGVALLAIILPVSGLFMRRSPEDHGLYPDGAEAPVTPPSGAAAAPPLEVNWTRAQAMRTRTAWTILTAQLLMALGLSGTLVHRVGFWQDLHMSPSLVALGTAADPFTVIFSALLFGMIGERVPIRVLGLIAGVGMASSMLPMIFTSGQWYTIFMHNITWGAFAGSFITVNNMIWANYFGRGSLGAIQGVVLPVAVIANGFAAPAYGLLLDNGVPPSMLWITTLTLFVTAGILLFFSKPPKLPTKVSETAFPAMKTVEQTSG